ncbi:hypothetical protein D9M68_998510 [compost metagenome]
MQRYLQFAAGAALLVADRDVAADIAAEQRGIGDVERCIPIDGADACCKLFEHDRLEERFACGQAQVQVYRRKCRNGCRKGVVVSARQR